MVSIDRKEDPTSNECKREGRDSLYIPALLNQLLAIVASAARPRSRSWEKSFILIEGLAVVLECSWICYSQVDG